MLLLRACIVECQVPLLEFNIELPTARKPREIEIVPNSYPPLHTHHSSRPLQLYHFLSAATQLKL